MKIRPILTIHGTRRSVSFVRIRKILVLCTALALADKALALDPPPGGGYPNQITALGDNAMFDTSTQGLEDTALGFEAMYSNTTGADDTAIGASALHENASGGGNVAAGTNALYNNTTAMNNVGIGINALVANTTGNGNVAVGATALQAHTVSIANTGVGYGVMSIGSTGNNNTAVGNVAMAFSTGSANTALGNGAMNMGTSNNNVAIGYDAGLNLAGDSNIVIGYLAGQNLTTGANNIEIGNQGSNRDANTIRLGDTSVQKKAFIAGIGGATVSGVAVMVTNKGQLGVATSSARYKDNIQPMAKSSEAVLSLKPVTFHYKKDLDPDSIPQFGLVAEDVAKVDADLVAKDDKGEPYTVRYEAVNAMLLNEFLKEHKKVEEQASEIAELKSALKDVTARLDARGL